MVAPSPVVVSKIQPPTATGTTRVGVDPGRRIRSDTRYVAIVAPPGYGKTLLARELHAAAPAGTAAWLSVDLLDQLPYAFWAHLIAALQQTTATIDDEPFDLLTERPSTDPTFLASLCEQLRRSPDRLLLVLDDVDRIDDPGVLAGLERLADWADGRLRLVLTGRVDPNLPLAKWRSQGSLVEFRQDDLRLDRDASQRFVAELAPGLLDPVDVDALHDRVEGWPVALQVALLVARQSDDPSATAREIAGTDRLVADYLTGELLDSLSADERDVALGLSVLDWFDLDLCHAVIGPSSVPLVRGLIDRRIPLVQIAGRQEFRFHSLVRELLESELGWRDPERRIDLHRRAGEAVLRRGDRVAAVRHLLAAGEHDRASEVLAGPAIALVDEGRIDELRLALAQLPADTEVQGLDRVVDLAFAYLLVGRRADFERLVERARAMCSDEEDAQLQSRLRLLLISEASLSGRRAEASRLIDEDDRHTSTDDAWYWDARRTAILARSCYSLDLPDLEQRLDALRRSSAPPVVRKVVVPSVESLWAMRRGELAAARHHRAMVAAAGDLVPNDSHPTNFEAMLAAGWCEWAVGSFGAVQELTDRLLVHPLSAFPLFRVQVDALVVERLVRIGDAAAAVAHLGRTDATDLVGEATRAEFGLAMARALHHAGQDSEVEAMVSAGPSSPVRSLLLAWSAVGLGRSADVERHLIGHERWPTRLAVEAGLAAALATTGSARDDLVRAALADGASDGWIAPFLGHASPVDDLVRRLAPETHPALASWLDAERIRMTGRSRGEAPVGGPLTERELTLVELLPTHLSYSQMGERLYVSVNTIKSNLKSVYRKLGATTRDEAIRAARDAGLLDVSPR